MIRGSGNDGRTMKIATARMIQNHGLHIMSKRIEYATFHISSARRKQRFGVAHCLVIISINLRLHVGILIHHLLFLHVS
ncbi:hypothetical protein Sjap_018380 [Stephania japonica]|uniref:Uncharacterized protein n=1 Tax=Stephania japonica TaxID=461633 RepID=A0AAP0NLG9_9MAGN